MRLALTALLSVCALGLSGCVTVPVPPVDAGNMKAGQLGRLRVVVTAKWEPNWSGVIDAVLKRQLPPTDGLKK